MLLIDISKTTIEISNNQLKINLFSTTETTSTPSSTKRLVRLCTTKESLFIDTIPTKECTQAQHLQFILLPNDQVTENSRFIELVNWSAIGTIDPRSKPALQSSGSLLRAVFVFSCTFNCQLNDRIDSVSCRQCGSNVLEGGFDMKCLPSDNWLELVDCWMCHDDQKLNLGTVLKPRANVILYNHRQIRVLNQSLCNAAVGDKLTCNNCNIQLGGLLEPSVSALEKSLLTFHSNDRQTTFDVESIFAHEIAHRVDMNASYHFLVETNIPFLIWVLNTDNYVMTMESSFKWNTERLVRLMFRKYISDGNNTYANDIERVDGFRSEDCLEIMNLLERRTIGRKGDFYISSLRY